MIQAEGRELIGTATFGAKDNWNDAAWQTTQKGDGNAVQNYAQLYPYDAVGNILELQHIATAGSYTRTYEIASDNNQLLNITVGQLLIPINTELDVIWQLCHIWMPCIRI